ncbi:MAG: DUF5615 family PIN-like protein [Gemmatimonadota bacterium]
MRLLCDEGVDQQIVDRLRSDQHDVTYIAESAPGLSDEEVFALANQANAVLVTTDKDFGELVFRQGRVSSGVVLLRLIGISQQRKAESVATVFRTYGGELQGVFAVIEPTRVRIRRAR